MKAIPATKTCAAPATSQLDGVTLGAGITTLVRVGQGSASIIILPVVRIERDADGPSGLEPGTSAAPGRKRRPRGSR